MKNCCKLVGAICFLILNYTNKINAQSYPWQDSSFALVFIDDFNGSSLDQNKWLRRFTWGPGYIDSNKVEMGAYCGSPMSGTYVDIGYREYNYADTNFLKINSGGGGSAKIISKKQTVTGETWSWPNDVFTVKQRQFKYCTSMLSSKYKFKYGYFEIRFKLPVMPTAPQSYMGYGPNFWLFGADPPNNYWSEIDIFEIHGYNALVTNNIIYQGDTTSNSGKPYSQPMEYSQVTTNVWHTAGAYWTPENIEIYFDGVKINQINNPHIKPDSLTEMPIVIDTNVPTSGWCEPFDTVNTATTYTYEIDFVKVWQRKEACDTNKTYCTSFNPATYKSKIYNSVEIGGTSCNDAVTNTSNLSLLGSDFVLLNEGFSIDVNSNVLINVLPCSGTSNGLRLSQSNFIEATPISIKNRYKKYTP